MAIQEAINQGITTAAVIGQLNEVPQARKEYKSAVKLKDMTLDAIQNQRRVVANVMEDYKNDKINEKEAEERINKGVKSVNDLADLTKEAAKNVALRRGDAILFKEVSQLGHLQEFSFDIESKANTRVIDNSVYKNSQKNNVKARRDNFTASIGGQEIKDPKLLEKIKEASKNGK